MTAPYLALRASEVEPRRVRWLWEGRIPLGKLTVLDGDPGLGKSLLTIELIARLTSGRAMPDASEAGFPGVALVLSAEDDSSDTIVPRLIAAGADLDGVHIFSGVFDEEGTRPPSFPLDITQLQMAIEDFGAILVVIDPLVPYLDATVNSHRDQDVRRALHALKDVAEATGAAFLLLRHLNKAAGGNPLYRGGGSIGIIGAARAGLLMAADPEDPERRILANQKANLAPPAPSLALRVVPSDDPAVPVVSWEGRVEVDAHALLQIQDPEERGALLEAREFLRDLLADGPVPAREADKAAREADISKRTLAQAKRAERVRSVREGPTGPWRWEYEGQSAAPQTTGTVGDVGIVGTLGDSASPLPAALEGGSETQDAQIAQRAQVASLNGYRQRGPLQASVIALAQEKDWAPVEPRPATRIGGDEGMWRRFADRAQDEELATAYALLGGETA